MPIIHECCTFLQTNAIGKWKESYRFKDKETDEYVHPIQRGMLLLRVETGQKRAFYWLYNIQDAIRFNEFVGLQLKAEAHEIILTPRVRLFFDIDLPLDEFQKNEFADHYGFNLTDDNERNVMDEVGKRVAVAFKESILISFEENGVDIDNDLIGFDYFYTMRNRVIDNDGFKVSIHLITNLMLPMNACSAIVSNIKSDIIPNNVEVLGINSEMSELMTGSIDETQYRRHGSLSLPFGTKNTSKGYYTNWMFRDYSIPNQKYFLTIEDQFVITNIDLSGYNIRDSVNVDRLEASPEFVKEALNHVGNIKDYNSRVWDINASVLKKSTMYVKRYSPSFCSICKRTHDNDNTMFLIFNSEKGIASWKCARSPEKDPIIFYSRVEEDDENDIDAFAKKHSNIKQKKIIEKKENTPSLNYVKYDVPRSDKEGYEHVREVKSKKHIIKTNTRSSGPKYDKEEPEEYDD